ADRFLAFLIMKPGILLKGWISPLVISSAEPSTHQNPGFYALSWRSAWKFMQLEGQPWGDEGGILPISSRRIVTAVASRVQAGWS
ncbi:MAG: hypothetical protein ACREXU_01420, partial [Gammaproteobacteria bacterium]